MTRSWRWVENWAKSPIATESKSRYNRFVTFSESTSTSSSSAYFFTTYDRRTSNCRVIDGAPCTAYNFKSRRHSDDQRSQVRSGGSMSRCKQSRDLNQQVVNNHFQLAFVVFSRNLISMINSHLFTIKPTDWTSYFAFYFKLLLFFSPTMHLLLTI